MYYDTNNNTIKKVLDNVLNLLHMNLFYLPITFNNPIKAVFYTEYPVTFEKRTTLIVNSLFLIKKNGGLKIIGVQNYLKLFKIWNSPKDIHL